MEAGVQPSKASPEERARAANAPDVWNAIWKAEGQGSWRQYALARVYQRIERSIPARAHVVDVGGGVGILAKRIKTVVDEARVEVWDISREAIEECWRQGIQAQQVDLEDLGSPLVVNADVVVATEIAEHLSDAARRRLLAGAARGSKLVFVSVPNNCLGPDEEPQHAVQLTAVQFKRLLEEYWPGACRVEVHGPYLLGVCGVVKPYRLSMTMPVRDEEEDIEATLASFRGVADEIVVGVDPRSKDRTRELVEQYADVVFDLADPEGPPEDRVPEGGVHFAWVRNQCMDRCTGDWIFMTEGHERLVAGEDVLLHLEDVMPASVRAALVLRTSKDQQWAFPWLCRNDGLRYARSTHNVLDIPENAHLVRVPQIKTLHERSRERDLARREQRKAQNRLTLMDDWIVHRNHASLFYLANEWREHDKARTVQLMREYLRVTARRGVERYQARLILAKTLYETGEPEAKKEAREVLMGCSNDDWSRTEHWIWLGDMAHNDERYEEALRFYLYASTTVGDPPFTMWWIDLPSYSYTPAQRLVSCYAALGKLPDALLWARRFVELLPQDAPDLVQEEARRNVEVLEEACREPGTGAGTSPGA